MKILGLFIFIPVLLWAEPRVYDCQKTAHPIKIDGILNDQAWESTPWTEDFIDIEGDKKPKPRFRTRVKMTWDDRYFYVAAELEEPHVWATLTQRDSVIFHDNDLKSLLIPTETPWSITSLKSTL